jgi:protein-tyrosine phosphatase
MIIKKQRKQRLSISTQRATGNGERENLSLFSTGCRRLTPSIIYGDDFYDVPVEILPSVYLGSERNSLDPEVLKRLNIKSIINVAEECRNIVFEMKDASRDHKRLTIREGDYLHLPWSHFEQNIKDHLPKALSFISKQLNSEKSILIHCKQGICRSASLVIAYVMIEKGLNFEDAYKFVKTKSPNVSPNLLFVYQLMDIQDDRTPQI